VRRQLSLCLAAALALLSPGAQAQAPAAATDLDRFMATALQRRDIDKKTLSDYVLDEVETRELLGPGRVPIMRMRREYTWFVRDGFHIRSPLKFDGVPIPESERRAYEERWLRSEGERAQVPDEARGEAGQEGKGPCARGPVDQRAALRVRVVLHGLQVRARELLPGRQGAHRRHDVLKIDYLPTKLFNEGPDESDEDADARRRAEGQGQAKRDKASQDRNPTTRSPARKSARRKKRREEATKRAGSRRRRSSSSRTSIAR
jgi:hypothetical protein